MVADRSVTVRLRANVRDFNRDIGTSAAAVGTLESRLRSADKEGGASIDRLSGRLRVLAEVAAVAGQALGPLGGVAIAGLGGLASQIGFAAVAGGVLIGSLQGVGDALGKMNDAQIKPSIENLNEARDALRALSPEAREFAQAAFDLKPALVAIRDMGAEELAPGLTESLGNLERLGPRAAGIFQSIAGTLGELADSTTESFASSRWADFFDLIEREAPDAITELAATVGDLTHGMAELWEAFTPLNDDFSSWLMGVANGFDEWATGLSATDGFAEFVDYIQTTGPQVADTLGALANAIIQIVQASAPLGGPVLAGFEAAANVIASIADSDLGTPIMAGVAALSLLNRTLAVTASLSKTSLSSGLFAGLGTATAGVTKGAGGIKALGGDLAVLSRNFLTAGTASERMAAQNAMALGNLKQTGAVAGKAAGALGGLALVSSSAADSLGLTNTTSLALMGTLGGAPGIAIGAAAGALLDMRAAGMGATEAIRGLDAAMQSGDMGVLTEQIAAAKAELADITNLDFNPGDIFDRIGFSVADTFGGPSMDDARAKIEESERALDRMAQAEKSAAAEAKGAALEFLAQTGANVDLGKWSRRSAESIKAQADAIIKAREEADKTARSFVGLGDSLNDGKVSLNQWIRDMDSTADALNNFTTNSIKAGKRDLEDGLIRQLQAAGKEGALRMRQLANGTDEQIDRANAAFRRGEKAIERYNNYKVPPKKVTADTSRAMQSFREVDQYLSSLDGKTATTYVNTVRTVTGPKGAAIFGQADGGTVPGPRHPYGDKTLILAAPGEEVITNRHGEADAFRADRAAGRIPAYADGGTVGGDDSDDPKKPKRPPKPLPYGLPAETAALIRQFGSLRKALAASEKAVDRETNRRDYLQGKLSDTASAMSDLADITTASFMNDPFRNREGSSNIWAAGARAGGVDPIASLDEDIAAGQRRIDLQQQLKAAGLGGTTPQEQAALAEALKGSNDELATLLANGQVQALEDKLIQRQSLASMAGTGAAELGGLTDVYAAQQRELEAQTAEMRDAVAELRALRIEERARERRDDRRGRDNADRVGAAVTGPATSSKRRNANKRSVKPR